MSKIWNQKTLIFDQNVHQGDYYLYALDGLVKNIDWKLVDDPNGDKVLEIWESNIFKSYDPKIKILDKSVASKLYLRFETKLNNGMGWQGNHEPNASVLEIFNGVFKK